jgi:predicted AAA+ superfamily ATPase
MNISHSEYVLKQLKKYKFVKEWINGKYKEKPLIIYGTSGVGKTSLAEYILKDFTKVVINVESCKNITSLKDHLDMSLYKKSITMMFSKKNVYNGILFDDLNYLQLNVKILFK